MTPDSIAMVDLLKHGALTPLDGLSAELVRRVEACGLGPPRAFERLVRQILVDHPEHQALVLPPGTTLDGDLDLESDAFTERGIATIAALGDLTVLGRIINESSDGGPFLIVDGDLRARQIEKGGASFVVLGSVTSDGLILCEEELGTFLVGGSLTAPAVVCCGHDINVAGSINSRLIDAAHDDLRHLLVAEVFEEPENPSDTEVAPERIRERMAAGLPVLRQG